MPAGAHVIENEAGDRASILEFGARLQSLLIRTDSGPVDVVLGHADPNAYLSDDQSLGAVVGRIANRVSGASFELDGVRYPLDTNEPPNQLHGGSKGFGVLPWTLDSDVPRSADGLSLQLVSPAGDMGYPGELKVRASYRWLPGRVLQIEFVATSDAPTIVNLTHHAYFNLAGAGDSLDHRVSVDAEYFTPTDAKMIPTGEQLAVAGTALELRGSSTVGELLAREDPQLQAKHGFDHNYVLPQGREADHVVASVHCPRSGIWMEVMTNQPCLQLYTGNWLGAPFEARQGLCLEPQGWPDAINQRSFPDPILRPGETYRWDMRLRFRS